MDKAERLRLLKEIGQRHAERELLMFTGIPLSDDDVKDEVQSMDTFREENRDKSSAKGINSDET